jgi:hypothetical protein
MGRADQVSVEPAVPVRDELLRVSCASACGTGGDFGKLIVTPGAIRWEAAAWERRLAPPVVHGTGRLLLKRPRLTPPWWRYSLMIWGEEALVATFFSPLKIGRVLRALEAAGLPYDEEQTWIDIGYGTARFAQRSSGYR